MIDTTPTTSVAAPPMGTEKETPLPVRPRSRSAPSNTYYGRPVLKAPVWKDAVGLYFFTGGLAGAAGALAFGARLAGKHELARGARRLGLVAASASAPLLIADLGRPERFLNMLRVFKPTSPMSVGTWLLTSFSGASALANLAATAGGLGPIGAAADAASAVLGLPLSTYTAVLLADTQVPVWHEARMALPMVFAASSAASAGASSCLFTAPKDARPARRLAVFGALVELASFAAMEVQLGHLAKPYKVGAPARLARTAQACTAAGAALLLAGTRSRRRATAGDLALIAGTMAERLAILRAGPESAHATSGVNTIHS
ncbi:MAG TPA: NrfD/PsrC family molybdoenzyme membrane anchor subunit [Chloroflexota bacterium]|nr:NrfD/PsrC family molybdoenzyme membrane anchor subunit [Chloroflexota bacterium]